MKRKLKIVFILITLALSGIIVFQTYWTVNAYQVNKEKFDTNVNTAMQRAMDHCKKDYFDSIRRVLVRRLSPPETTIKIDTLPKKINLPGNGGIEITRTKIADNSQPRDLQIRLSNKYTSLGHPINVSTSELDSYRKNIHYKATNAELLTEMSLNTPNLMNEIITLLGMYDIQNRAALSLNFSKKHPNASMDTILKFSRQISNSVYDLPPNYNLANNLRLKRHLQYELRKLGIFSPAGILSSQQNIPHFKLNMHYSETKIYAYKYQGFTLFNITGPVFYVRAVFFKPQYAVLKNMVLSMALSVLLMLFVFFCFYYIVRTIVDQKKLADLKDDFINNMTHELKTPIATISVAIEGLQKFNALNDPEKTQRYLQTSRNELSRLNELVTKVLDIAAFENKEIELVKEPVNIDELVNEVTASEKSKTTKTVNITYENKGNINSVPADKIHFRNVLINLVDNAIKYSNDPVDIVIACYKSEGDCLIVVKDNGIGIPQAHTGLIFDKFHRVPKGNVHAVKGTGLGLSYVKYIVEAHGGGITVKSEINKGTEFIVSIPLSNE